MEIKNKKAFFDYHIVETETAGIMLSGSEIKSIREGNINIVDAYVQIHNGEAWLKKLYIAPYENGGYANHDPNKDRKLLMTKKQISKWEKQAQTEKLTIVALGGFFTKNEIFKINVGLVRGKKNHDKRDSIRTKDIERDNKRNE